MNLSVFYDHIRCAAEQKKKPLAEVLKAVREMGYTMAEVDFDALNRDSSIADTLRAADMGIASVYCFFRFEKEKQQERIRQLVDTALAAGVKRVMPIPGFFQQESKPQEELERMLASMQELCTLADQAGLTVTIEDFGHAMSPINSSAGMRLFLDALPTLQATFDTGNFSFTGEAEMSAFQVLKDRIAHVHLKDWQRTEQYGTDGLKTLTGTQLYPSPIGKGIVPMGDILQNLRQIGYDGALSVEHFGCTDQFAAMQDSAAFVRSFFPQL